MDVGYVTAMPSGRIGWLYLLTKFRRSLDEKMNSMTMLYCSIPASLNVSIRNVNFYPRSIN